jgi:hypothetical protein
MNIHENGVEFKHLSHGKVSKTKDILFYKDFSSAIPSNNNNKELAVRTARATFNLICTSRLDLLIDLLLCKDLWNLKNNPLLSPRTKRFECYKEMIFNEPSSYIPVHVTILHSTLLVECVRGSSKEPEQYVIRYSDIYNIISLSYAITINTKVIVKQPLE